MKLSSVRASLVEDLGAVTPRRDELVNLLDRERARLGKGHATHRRALDIRRRDRGLTAVGGKSEKETTGIQEASKGSAEVPSQVERRRQRTLVISSDV